MSLVIVSPLTPATGNATTAHRLSSLLAPWLPSQQLVDAAAADAGAQLARACQGSVRLCVAVHAFRSGRFFLAEDSAVGAAGAPPPPPPLIVVLAGTDINMDVESLGGSCGRSGPCSCGGAGGLGGVADGRASSPCPDTRRASERDGSERDATARACVIAAVLARATAVVAFSTAMGERYLRFVARVGSAGGGDALAAATCKLRVIPQGVDVAEIPPLGAPPAAPLPLRAACGLSAEARVLLLAAGVRQVKDPLFLVPAVREWHAEDSRVHMVVVGPALDAALAAQLWAQCGAACGAATGTCCGQGASCGQLGGCCSGVRYHPPVPRATLLQWLRECDIALNSSVTEGQSGTLLEAQALGTPVVARRNEGNAAIIRHGETGMLFDTPAQAVSTCRTLLADQSELRSRIVHAAGAAVDALHSPQAEARAWHELILRLL